MSTKEKKTLRIKKVENPYKLGIILSDKSLSLSPYSKHKEQYGLKFNKDKRVIQLSLFEELLKEERNKKKTGNK